MSPEQQAALAEGEKFLKDNNVKFLLAQFVDIHGAAKTKMVPARQLKAIVKTGAGFAGFATWGMGMEPHDPDFMARGDLSTLTLLPWQPGYARIVCVGHVNDVVHEYDSRAVLMKQVARLAERGYTLNTGLEPEFFLLVKDEDGNVVVPDESDTLDKPCYDYKGLSRQRHYLEALSDGLEAAGLDVYQTDHEDGNGQFEINYTYSDALDSADAFTLVRMGAGEIANDHGMICTFMPKPFGNRAGSGMHIHCSITSDGENNLFNDDNDPNGMGLSKLAKQFMAGLIHHANALCALSAPTVNSYKRLTVGTSLSGATYAPAYISWGGNNRSSMVRVPYGRIEYRLADGGCNPYLVIAAVIAAGLDGIDRDLDPGVPRNVNHYGQTQEELDEMGVKILPQNLDLALNELEKNPLFRDQMGPVIDEFIKLKRMEWIEYMKQVSKWELDRYLEFV
ncbi:MAG: type III glutamate--ammonia ligase [Pseudomonadales bacterium]